MRLNLHNTSWLPKTYKRHLALLFVSINYWPYLRSYLKIYLYSVKMLESGDYLCHMDIYVYCFGANIKELTLFLVYPG
jgi:hypothetical protein